MTFTSFWFSSRRRHTRSDRDWSSDVCSSALASVLASVYLNALFATVTLAATFATSFVRSEEHTSELQSRSDVVCRLLLEKNCALCVIVPAAALALSVLTCTVQPLPAVVAPVP